MVYNCRPPLLPVSLQLGDLGAFAQMRPKASASVAVPPWEVGPSVSDVNSNIIIFPKLAVAPLIDSGTDLEDELPTPDNSPGSAAVSRLGPLCQKFALRPGVALI